MTDLPRRALSVRQPWAWAIIHARKDVENRSKGFFGRTKHSYFLGPVAIHAAKGMTQDEYRDAAEDIERITGAPPPRPDELIRGGIIGAVDISGIYASGIHSPWWAGNPHFGLIIDQSPGRVRAVEPIPCSGMLGYFSWTAGGELEQPLRWMKQWSPACLV